MKIYSYFPDRDRPANGARISNIRRACQRDSRIICHSDGNYFSFRGLRINGIKLAPGQVWADEDHAIEWLYIGASRDGFPVFERLWDGTILSFEKYYRSDLLKRFIGITDSDGRVI